MFNARFIFSCQKVHVIAVSTREMGKIFVLDQSPYETRAFIEFIRPITVQALTLARVSNFTLGQRAN